MMFDPKIEKLNILNKELNAVSIESIDEATHLSLKTYLKTDKKDRQFLSALTVASSNDLAKKFINDSINIAQGGESINPNKPLSKEIFTNKNETSKRTINEGHHIYSKNSAMFFYPDTGRSRKTVIAVDGASDSKGQSYYDWNDKQMFHITLKEIPEFLAVLLGLKNKCEFSNHGKQRNKSLSIEKQEEGYYVKLMIRDCNLIAVHMDAGDTFFLINIAFNQLKANQPGIESKDILLIIKQIFSI